MNPSKAFMAAAVAGILTAGSAMVAAPAQAAAAEKGHCVGANACKGKGACKQAAQNECKGQNGCKGKGFAVKTKAQCDKLAKKNDQVHFESAEKM